MRAVINRYFCGDMEDLSSYEPGTPQVFGFTLTFAISPENGKGEDFFEVLVASADYLAQQYPETTFLRHVILASDYNVPAAVALIAKYVSSLQEDSWEMLAAKIGRVARWEYEDYRRG